MNTRMMLVGLGGMMAAMVGLVTPAVHAGGAACAAMERARQERAIELALCLDTSGSMEGLIESAKQKLWAIVNDLAMAEPVPRLRVALLTYGNDGHNAENGWVAVETPFTDDLDLVSGKLFALRTNGGTEYVGRVLHAAETLDWSAGPAGLRLVVVAGNESADQDPDFPFRERCRSLIARDIMVNSIYCGPVADEIAPGWKEVARLADGQFASIDKDHGTVVIETPFDEELGDLSAAINTTYLPFGAHGAVGAANQVAQDGNAASLNGAAVAERCSTKGGALYGNARWDLVDACRQEGFDLAAVQTEDLPEDMQSMTPEQRAAHVAEMTRKRAEIQARIADLTARRTACVEEEMKKQSLAGNEAFDLAVRQALRAQAVSKGFAFKD